MRAEIFFKDTIKILEKAPNEWKDPFRYPSFATIRNNRPQQRTVVFRHYNPIMHRVQIYSDPRSQKWDDLSKNPAGHLCFYDMERKLQIRMDIQCRMFKGDAVDEMRENITPYQHFNYQTVLDPGTPIDQFNAEYHHQVHFGIIQADILQYELLQLFKEDSARLRVDVFERELTYQWLVP